MRILSSVLLALIALLLFAVAFTAFRDDDWLVGVGTIMPAALIVRFLARR